MAKISLKKKVGNTLKTGLSIFKSDVKKIGNFAKTQLKQAQSSGLLAGAAGAFNPASTAATKAISNAVTNKKQTYTNLPPKNMSLASGGFIDASGKKQSGTPSATPLVYAPTGGGSSGSVSRQQGQVAGASTFSGDIVPLSSSQTISSFSGTQPTTRTSIPVSNITNTPNLGMNNLFNYPDATTPDYLAAIPPSIDQQRLDIEKQQQQNEADYLNNLIKDFNRQESASEIDARLQKELGIKQKQQQVNDLTGKLNAIVAQGQANQLSLVGQGRGIPEAIIGGQQAQIARETAIQALPVQAQLEAAQGNLEMANESLDRLFKIYSEEADREFQFKKEVRTFLYESANAKQKAKLAQLDKLDDRRYQELRDLHEEQQSYAKMAFANGQSTLGSRIAKLDYKSPTFRQDLANLQAKLYNPMQALDRQIKEAQLAAEKSKTSSAGGLSPTGSSVINVARELLNNPELGRITGTIDQLGGGLISDQAKLARNKWKQLKGILSLENRQLLKGSGAISDFEFRVLGEAATALGRNLSDNTFRSELNKLITTLSPEYSYIDNISGIIDSNQGGGLPIGNYLNKLGL